MKQDLNAYVRFM